MSFGIHITHAAQQDIDGAADYLEFVLKNPNAADSLLTLAADAFASLAENPKMYPISHDSVLRSWGIRFVAINSYLAFYTIDEQANLVYIVRFLYGKRDWITILREQHLP